MRAPIDHGYGAIATSYAALSEPLFFAAPAAALVALLEPAPASRFLDVGCGTGAVSAGAARAVSGGGRLVASDLSPGMLASCRARLPAAQVVAALLPFLPHADHSFDVAAAAFVLGHLADPVAGLVEMRRVLRPGGRLGISSWAENASSSAPGRIWQQHLEARLGAAECAAVAARHWPSDALLADPAAVRRLLERAGLEAAEVLVRPFPVTASTGDFVAARAVTLPARHLRARLDTAAWHEHLAGVRRELLARFGSRVDLVLSVCLARAVAPGARL